MRRAEVCAELLVQQARTGEERRVYHDARREIERAPLEDEVDVLIVGGGFGGLITGARLREAGFDSIRIVEQGGGFEVSSADYLLGQL